MTTFRKMQQMLIQRLGLGEKELFPEQSLQNLGIDSLVAMELMFDLREEFGIDVPYGQHRVATLGDLVAVIDRQLVLLGTNAFPSGSAEDRSFV